MNAAEVAGFVVVVVILPVALNESAELSGWLAKRLVRWGARRLGAPEEIARYEEEWLADLAQVPGKITKVGYACGVLMWSVPRLRSQVRRRAAKQAKPAEKARRAESVAEVFPPMLHKLLVAVISGGLSLGTALLSPDSSMIEALMISIIISGVALIVDYLREVDDRLASISSLMRGVPGSVEVRAEVVEASGPIAAESTSAALRSSDRGRPPRGER
ncbi:hypothetical protein KDL01_12915 [Actinospica durhamensis]|uniref:Uncharacterized protein n=1 Tax=Actinospica durhamensis TaxID=1508375 RepID=A0A941EUK2_9ACTN|nr:hypothetical protein [Actinospica durhamensis]MBR7834169.1 hypothetical protein [Actinospica durhamensis]